MDNEELIKIYKKIYGLPEIFYREEVDENFFQSCSRHYYFIVLCIYNEKKEYLIIRDIDKNIGWELVGGHLQDNERIENAINRITQREAGLKIDELEPVCIISNTFICGGREFRHQGIAFSALSRGKMANRSTNIKSIFVNTIPSKIAYRDKDILLLANSKISENFVVPPYNEIDNFHAHHFRFKIHHFLMFLFNHLTTKKILKNIVSSISNHPKSILDVACGDDETIFELAKIFKPRFVIANDISWESIQKKKEDKNAMNLIFTNHDALKLPLKEKLDLIILKNTLHHIPKEQQSKLLQKLSDLSNQLIVIDIEDPRQTSVLAKIWNWYYLHFLGDQGKSFLNRVEFRSLIEKNIHNKKLIFRAIKTIKGDYLFASIGINTQSNDSVNSKNGQREVEIKIKIDQIQAEKIKAVLKLLGAKPMSIGQEKDIYFTAPHRDFIKTKECLRIREKDNFKEITYKGASTGQMKKVKQFWKNEQNIMITSSVIEAENFLELIGFSKVAEVIKKREKFTLDDQEICIDSIRGLGYFLEIEIIVDSQEEINYAVRKNEDLLQKLKLQKNCVVKEPYRDLVMRQNAHLCHNKKQ